MGVSGVTMIVFSPPFKGQLVAVVRGHHLIEGRIGHGAVRTQIPWSRAFQLAAHRLGKDSGKEQDRQRLLGAVLLRHTRDPDKRTGLDIGQRDAAEAPYLDVVRDVELQV